MQIKKKFSQKTTNKWKFANILKEKKMNELHIFFLQLNEYETDPYIL